MTKASDLVLDILRQIESGGNNFAVSSAGAVGPYQIMEATAKSPGYGVQPLSLDDRTDPNKSREFARDYLRAMEREFGGDTVTALAAWNAGPKGVEKFRQTGNRADLPKETQGFLRKFDEAGLGDILGNAQAEREHQHEQAQEAVQGLTKWLVKGKDASHADFDPEFGGALAKLLTAAPHSVYINSGKRSREAQEFLWNKYGRNRARVAPPGHSRHEYGRAADLSFSSPAAREWIHANAANYGLGFPVAGEDWHIELVGADGTRAPMIAGSSTQDGLDVGGVTVTGGIGKHGVKIYNPDANYADGDLVVHEDGNVYKLHKRSSPDPTGETEGTISASWENLGPYDEFKGEADAAPTITAEEIEAAIGQGEIPEGSTQDVPPQVRDPEVYRETPLTAEEVEELIEQIKPQATFSERVDDLSLFNDYNKFDVSEPVTPAERGGYESVMAMPEPELMQMVAYGNPDYARTQAALNELGLRRKFSERSFAENISDPEYRAWEGRRVVRQTLSGIPRIPGDVVTLSGFAASGLESLTGADLNSDRLLATGQQLDRGVSKAFGVGDSRNFVESLGRIAGSALPIGGGIKAASGSAAALPAQTLEVLTPLTVGGGKAFAANVGVQFAADQLLTDLLADNEDYKTVQDVAAINADVDPVLAQSIVSPDDATTFAGYAGLFAAGSLGSAYVAKAIRSMPSKPVAARTIDSSGVNAPASLQTITTPAAALEQLFLDETGSLVRMMDAAGVVDPQAMKRAIRANTLSAIRSRTLDAIDTGKMSSMYGRWDAPTNPRAFIETMQQHPQREAISAYLHTLDLFDDLSINGGSTQSIQKALQDIQSYEAAIPNAKEIASKYRGIMHSVRAFLNQGPYKSISNQQYSWLNANRPNYVPLKLNPFNKEDNLAERASRTGDYFNASNEYMNDYFLKNRNVNTQTIENRVDAFDAMNDYLHAAMIYQQRNDMMGTMVDALHGSATGKNTAVKVKADEYKQRQIVFRRDGVQEHYAVPLHLKQALRLDPMQPLSDWAYSATQMMRYMTTGPGNVTGYFAPTTATRDMIFGMVTASGNPLTFPIATLAAIPRQLWARGKQAHALNTAKALEAQGIPTPAAQATAAKAADAWEKTLMYQFQQHGSFDASINATAIQAGRTRVASWSTSNVLPEALKRVGRLWLTTFEAIQEAPRFAQAIRVYEKAIKEGATATEAAEAASASARKLTGDTKRMGRMIGDNKQFMQLELAGGGVTRGATALAAPKLAALQRLLVDSAPFVNPMLQGTRRLVDAWSDKPLQFHAKVTGVVSTPFVLSYLWANALTNETGEDYIGWMMDNRSDADKVGRLYIADPERPANEAIQIPYPHELMWFGYPMIAGMDAYARDMKPETLNYLAAVSEITLGVANPIPVQAIMQYYGYNAPNTLFDDNPAYEIREHNRGIVDANFEYMVRTLTGIQGSHIYTALTSMAEAARTEGASWNVPQAFVEELAWNMQKSQPITREITGTRSASGFTADKQRMYNRIDTASKGLVVYAEAVLSEGDLRRSRVPRNDVTEWVQELDQSPGPLNRMPTNPILLQFGEEIYGAMERNDEALLGDMAVLSKYRKAIRSLKQYNAGNWKEYQEWYDGLEDGTTKNILEKLNYDPSDRTSVVRAIDWFEREATVTAAYINSKLDDIEKDITEQVKQMPWAVPKGFEFSFEKHLNPFDQNPFD